MQYNLELVRRIIESHLRSGNLCFITYRGLPEERVSTVSWTHDGDLLLWHDGDVVLGIPQSDELSLHEGAIHFRTASCTETLGTIQFFAPVNALSTGVDN